MSGSLRHPFIKWPTSLHLSPISVKPNLKFEGAKTQIIICLKEKINSYRYSLTLSVSFSNQLFGVLLNAGFVTLSGPTSVYHLLLISTRKSRMLEVLVAYENQVRPYFFLGSWLFWGITAFPGAFSAYRYIALQNDITGALLRRVNRDLPSFCLAEHLLIISFLMWHGSGADIFTANMPRSVYPWILHYGTSAYTVTDVEDQVSQFLFFVAFIT